MSKYYAYGAAAFVAILLSAMGILIARGPSTNFAGCESSGAVGGDIGGPFTLILETGDTVTDAEIITKPTLVYFGYTYCPDVCPLDAGRNAEALEVLENAGVDAQGLFITFDPSRDTPEVLTEFTNYLHPKMIGLTGPQAKIEQAAAAYRVYFKKQPTDDEEYYLMDHSNLTYLMMPEAGFVDFFRGEVTAEEVAKKTACYAASN